jgi:ABC-type nickel/cobalt efflux system permease component RcnA
MELMVFLLIIIAGTFIIYWVWSSKRKWKVVHSDKGMTEEASNMYAYLKEHNIRCRLTEHSPANALPNGNEGVKQIRIEVHADDLKKTNQLLRNFEPPRGVGLKL